jgi:hypothetical protein
MLGSAIVIMKTILVFPVPTALETPKLVFWKPTVGGLSKKTIFHNEFIFDHILIIILEIFMNKHSKAKGLLPFNSSSSKSLQVPSQVLK